MNSNKFWRLVTIVHFRFLVLGSLKYSSKAESPINKSVEAVIRKNPPTSRHNHLFIHLFAFICLFIYLFIYLVVPIFTEYRNYHFICIAIATDINRWPGWRHFYALATWWKRGLRSFQKFFGKKLRHFLNHAF